jgi:two-component system, chemotaxis family, response regulator PixG
MPNTNGYELCSFLRKSPLFKELPIVMLTGHDGVIDRLRAKVAGSTDFLGKPPDPKRVIEVVQKLLGDGLPTNGSPEVGSRRINQPVS